MRQSHNFKEVIEGILESLDDNSSITRHDLQELIAEKNQELGKESRSSGKDGGRK